MKKYTAIDLFCGAGGLTCGLKQAGFSVLAGIELQEIAAETYHRNHNSTLLLQDDIQRFQLLIVTFKTRLHD